MSTKRTVSLLLHAHLPFGLRPELPISLEESWLFEATTDCYLPLLGLISRLPGKKKSLPLAVSLSPTLLEQWAHPQFATRYIAHLERFRAILIAEQADPDLPQERQKLGADLERQILAAQTAFSETWGADLPAGWGRLAREGRVELLTTAVTHAFLPAHQNAPLTKSLQIGLGIERFTALTGVTPVGFWLPECGYYPGLEEELAAQGIAWFAVEDMGGPSIVRCPNGTRAIARQGELSQKVWDAQSGYPGHADYREFHQDAVHQLSPARAGLYRLPDGSSLPLGLKYWRVTGSGDKAWYDPTAARRQAEADAQDFIRALKQAPTASLTFLPFDAELFGHWWHEGPHWLETVLQLAAKQPQLTLVAPTAALAKLKEIPDARPTASTWGRRADYSFWINPETDWIYPLLASANLTLAKALQNPETDPLRRRAVAQLTRELLLAQASDWPFMLRAGATASYAEERLRRHLARFQYVAKMLACGEIDTKALGALEQLDPFLPTLDYTRYQ